MSLQTPTVIRTLQRKLYRQAKESKPPRRGRLRPELFSVCLTVKPVGEPDAGDRHVRFDERGWETERCRTAQATAPILDSTECDIARSRMDVRFSNRPFGVKRFQAIHHSSVDVAHGLALLFGLGTKGPSIMGFEDEVEQSFGRPCRQCDSRSKRTYELTSSIVPRGTSFHR
jgi:hypothetical protein